MAQVAESKTNDRIDVPAWTKFHPSVEAFQQAGMTIHGDRNAQGLGARIQIEAPKGGSATGEGVVGILRDEQGRQVAEYLTMPTRSGCTADVRLTKLVS